MHEKIPDDDPNKKYLRIIMREVMVLEDRISEITSIEDESQRLEPDEISSGTLL